MVWRLFVYRDKKKKVWKKKVLESKVHILPYFFTLYVKCLLDQWFLKMS